MALVLLYVDDVLIASNDNKKLEEIKCHLSKAFQMKYLDDSKRFLGMTIERNRKEKSIVLHQREYTENVLERFDMKESRPKNTSMVTRQVANGNRRVKINAGVIEENKKAKKRPYREVVGSLKQDQI